MTKIIRSASAGTLESNDVFVEIEPWDQGALDCVLRARVETAVARGREGQA